MDEFVKVKFGVRVEKMSSGWWSFGVCFSHYGPETYMYIKLFRWSISIGRLIFAQEEQYGV